MIVEQSKAILAEVSKAFIGKNEIVKKVLMTIYAGGHILLEDCPGVGKTTLAVAFSKTLGLSSKRIQFTPDTLPSDITEGSFDGLVARGGVVVDAKFSDRRVTHLTLHARLDTDFVLHCNGEETVMHMKAGETVTRDF